MRHLHTFHRLVCGEHDFALPMAAPTRESSWRTYFLNPTDGRVTTHKNRLGPGPFYSVRATTKAAAIMAFMHLRNVLNSKNQSHQGSADLEGKGK